jgi:hypothetical protein
MGCQNRQYGNGSDEKSFVSANLSQNQFFGLFSFSNPPDRDAQCAYLIEWKTAQNDAELVSSDGRSLSSNYFSVEKTKALLTRIKTSAAGDAAMSIFLTVSYAGAAAAFAPVPIASGVFAGSAGFMAVFASDSIDASNGAQKDEKLGVRVTDNNVHILKNGSRKSIDEFVWDFKQLPLQTNPNACPTLESMRAAQPEVFNNYLLAIAKSVRQVMK